jgi:hypothetical protein
MATVVLSKLHERELLIIVAVRVHAILIPRYLSARQTDEVFVERKELLRRTRSGFWRLNSQNPDEL